jgi:Protein of unknown function (DUF2690)
MCSTARDQPRQFPGDEMKTISTLAKKVLIALVPVAMLAITAPPVLADHYPADGGNPYANGCAATSWPVYTTWTGNGWLTVRYANACATAWAEFTCRSANGCAFFTLWAQRSDGTSSTIWVNWPGIGNGVTVYTPQLFDGGALSTSAWYQGYFGAPKYHTWAY